MTQHDPIAFIQEEAQPLIDELRGYEEEVAAARQAGDRDLRREAEEKCRRSRTGLLTRSNPTATFLYAVATGTFDSNAFRAEWASSGRTHDALAPLKEWDVDDFYAQHWIKDNIDLTILPSYTAFYIIDNPVRKDKVFKLPMVAPTGWKGALRHALWQLGHREDKPIRRLFGETRADNTGRSGRLHFYPTFFNKIGLEIINPHDRVRRVGKNPILFECVPQDAQGTFTLLYVPFDRIGQDDAETRAQVAKDLTLLAKGLQAMFTLYGFGAKTSSGFGLAEDKVSDGCIYTNVPEAGQQAGPPREPAMPEALRTFLERFPDEDFSLKPNAWRKQHNATNAQRRQYMAARAAHAKFEKAQAAYQAALAEWEAPAQEPVQCFLEAEFASFSQLAESVANTLAARLTTGGEA